MRTGDTSKHSRFQMSTCSQKGTTRGQRNKHSFVFSGKSNPASIRTKPITGSDPIFFCLYLGTSQKLTEILCFLLFINYCLKMYRISAENADICFSRNLIDQDLSMSARCSTQTRFSFPSRIKIKLFFFAACVSSQPERRPQCLPESRSFELHWTKVSTQ